MILMKNSEFVEKLKYVATLPTTYYSVAGGDWAKWNGSSWNFDCVILVKAILWGWCEDKNASHGGAKYASNGVYDDTADGLINRCSNVSTDFSNITAGELLYMKGHVGVYIGNGKVIECTAAWESKVVESNIGSNGERTRNGVSCGRWLKHGKLPYIEYIESTEPTTEPTTELKHKVGDTVKINSVYVSSTSTDRLNPAITEGKITKIVNGTRNPYLLENGQIGWVNDECIVSDTTTSVEYLSNTSYSGCSIVDALSQINVDSSYNYRSKLATANGINNYTGTAGQNTQLLDLLKNGKLIKA